MGLPSKIKMPFKYLSHYKLTDKLSHGIINKKLQYIPLSVGFILYEEGIIEKGSSGLELFVSIN